jgi:hypothetical protein
MLYLDFICTWMRSKKLNSETADAILKDGFSLISDDSMNSYVEGFTGGANYITYTLSDMYKNTNTASSKTELLNRLNEKTVEENFTPDHDTQAEIERILKP